MANTTTPPMLDTTGQQILEKLNTIASRVKPTGGGGGTGGTDNYEELDNKPQINNVPLVGNKSASDLGLQDEMSEVTASEATADWDAVFTS